MGERVLRRLASSQDTISIQANGMEEQWLYGAPTMTLFLFLVDQRIAAVEILLDEGVLDLRNALF